MYKMAIKGKDKPKLAQNTVEIWLPIWDIIIFLGCIIINYKIKTVNYNTPSLSCHRQITLSNNEEICPLSIPNQISFISMHVPSLVKIPWHLQKLRSGNENMGLSWADNSIKIWQICPLAIPNQMSTISMHRPSLVKIHWLKLSSGNENMSWADNSVKIWQNLPISNPKPDLHNINAHTKFGENPWCLLKLSSGSKIWMDGRM